MEGGLEKECLRQSRENPGPSASQFGRQSQISKKTDSQVSPSFNAGSVQLCDSVINATVCVGPWKTTHPCLGELCGPDLVSYTLALPKVSVMGTFLEGTPGLDPRLTLYLLLGLCSPTWKEFSKAGAACWAAKMLWVGWVLLSLGLSPPNLVSQALLPVWKEDYLWFIFDTRSSLPKFHQFVTVFIVSNCP